MASPEDQGDPKKPIVFKTIKVESETTPKLRAESDADGYWSIRIEYDIPAKTKNDITIPSFSTFQLLRVRSTAVPKIKINMDTDGLWVIRVEDQVAVEELVQKGVPEPEPNPEEPASVPVGVMTLPELMHQANIPPPPAPIHPYVGGDKGLAFVKIPELLVNPRPPKKEVTPLITVPDLTMLQPVEPVPEHEFIPSKRTSKRYCCVPTCNKNKSQPPYHDFPKIPAIRKAWGEAIGRMNAVNLRKPYVCTRHFLRSDYQPDLKAKLLNLPPKHLLKPGTIPSQNLKEEIPDSKKTKEQLMQERKRKEREERLAKRNREVMVEELLKNYDPKKKREEPILKRNMKLEPRFKDKGTQAEMSGTTQLYLSTLEKNLKKLREQNSALTNKVLMLRKRIRKSESKGEFKRKMCEALAKTFTESQARVIVYNKRVSWNDDDFKRGYALLSRCNLRIYEMFRTLAKIPLPSTSAIRNAINEGRLDINDKSLLMEGLPSEKDYQGMEETFEDEPHAEELELGDDELLGEVDGDLEEVDTELKDAKDSDEDLDDVMDEEDFEEEEEEVIVAKMEPLDA